jgi:hypothetical protein
MRTNISRRGFIELGSAAAATAIGVQVFARPQAAPPEPSASPPKFEKPPALKAEDVQAVVGAAHRDIDKVRELLDAQPSLVNATWDWGSGDFETPLGAAGHTGQVEIAELVLSRGARIELHCAAMLGWIDLIKAAVAARPGAENILGPHAIPMHSHARAGDEQAKDVLAYLESLNCLRDLPTEEDYRLKIAGRYRIKDGDDVLTVIAANRRLLLQPPAESGRRPWYMLHQGDGMFRPADNVQVKLTFDAQGDRVLAMNIDEGDDQAVALRIE